MGLFLSDRYELVRRVADGPIAVLHEGRLRGSAGFTRPVAVRELERRFAKDPRFVGTWAAAASEVAKRPSPHLEEVVDLVVVSERVYVVTEWVEGLSFAALLDAFDHAPWTLVTRVLVGVLDGLHRLHTIDPPLVHRGVAASAIRLSADGAVKLTRSGVAAGLAAIGEGRSEAERLGLWHAAPELIEGASATPAVDLFGVGLLAFEALASQPAFEGGDVRGEPRDLTVIRRDVPALLVSLVERALRPAPGDRFESADEMARALERLLHAEPTPVDAPSIGRAVRAARDRISGASDSPGPAALAMSLSRMKTASQEALPPKDKRPIGLTEQRTVYVDDTDLVEVPSEDDRKKRYRYEPKEREATERARGLVEQESEALPLVLHKVKSPRGLTPMKTEFLDEDQVDRLTLNEAPKSPRGLAPVKTEFLDEDQVDRLTLDPARPPPRPSGLSYAKTELVDGDLFDDRIEDDGAQRRDEEEE